MSTEKKTNDAQTQTFMSFHPRAKVATKAVMPVIPPVSKKQARPYIPRALFAGPILEKRQSSNFMEQCHCGEHSNLCARWADYPSQFSPREPANGIYAGIRFECAVCVNSRRLFRNTGVTNTRIPTQRNYVSQFDRSSPSSCSQ